MNNSPCCCKGDNMERKISEFLKEIIEIVKKPVMSILPGQLAFSFVLSIIPILAMIGLIGTVFSISIKDLTAFVKDTFPSATSNLLLPLINGKGFDTNILIFLVSAFLLASGGAYSIIVTSNILYNIKQTSELKRRIKSFIITLILLTLICFLVVVPGFGDQIILIINDLEFIDPISDGVLVFYHILKYPLSFVLIYFNIKLIYTISPDKTIKSSTVTIGALFTTFLWIILTYIFSYYVGHIARYDIFYGSLSNIIVLLLWMYLLSYIFVIGLALNAGNKTKKE